MKKDEGLIETERTIGFWFCAAILGVLFASIMARDIDRPFYGLHSWAAASGSWAARAHVKYGLGYTKGMSTWAVGDPPTQNPKRYNDHPQLNVLAAAFFMRIFGVNEASRRITILIFSVISLLLFLRILRGLLDDKTTLLAGLILVLFPISGYFGFGYFHIVTGLLAIWCYLVLIGAITNGPKPGLIHKIGLAAGLFLGLQFAWNGFFYALAIGLHYVFRCIRRKQWPDKTLLAILVLAPLLSLALDFTIMAAGYGWDTDKIVELYKWRSAKGEEPKFLWGKWFLKFFEFAQTNFTLPVLIAAGLYLTLGQWIILAPNPMRELAGEQTIRTRRFPQFWLFLMIPLSQLLILRGALWRHQTWEQPFGPFIAIAAALGLMLLWDILKKVHRVLAYGVISAVAVVGVVFLINGTNYYYAVRWQSPTKIKMLKTLNHLIPPNRYLLSFEPFMVNQHVSKGAYYRPEIAWHLDREIVQARTLEEIEKQAKTGMFPFYLMPVIDNNPYLNKLRAALEKRYQVLAVFPGESGEQTKDGKFFKAGMYTYIIFNLQARRSD